MSVETTLAIDPVAYLRQIEAAWQARDGQAAAAGYADDAVLIFGNGQERAGDELRAWPQQWFDFARDLRIEKTFRAFTGDCLASEWRSEYTHPRNGKRMVERGAEFFWIRPDGKVYRHHMFEHTWPEGENRSDQWPVV
jgi:nuclear transport factor 2 (NTF2) superfamily protein